MRTLLVTLFFFNVMLPPSTWAASGGYIGASLGSANVDDPQIPFENPQIFFDESDTGVKIFGGFRVNHNFAVEGFYVDFGDPEVNTIESGGPVTVISQITGFGVQAVGIAPLNNQFDVFGKFGIIIWDEDNKDNGAVFFTDDGTDLTYGFGGAYNVNEMVAIRVEWEFYDIEDAAGDLDVDLISIGVQVNF